MLGPSAVEKMPPSPTMDPVCRIVIVLCQRFIAGPDAAQEQLERCREAARVVLDALGARPITNHLMQRWEIVTTAKVFYGDESTVFDLIPYQSCGNANNVHMPVTLPYADGLERDLQFFLSLLDTLERALEVEDPDDNIACRIWFSTLKNSIEEFLSMLPPMSGLNND